MSEQEPKVATLSLSDLRLLISRTVEEVLDEQVLFDHDCALGRCPYCHGKRELLDPVMNDKVPCICTGAGPDSVLGIA